MADFTVTLNLARTTPEGPFESFQLGIDPVDSDGISLSSYNLDTSLPADSNDRELVAATKVRFGRLSISNTHGSELLPLNIQLTTEYFNGTEFVKNNDDSCTVFNLANDFSISDPADSNCSLATNTSPVSIGSSGQVKAVMANTTVNNGATQITISADTDVTKGPGSGNTGYIEITSNLLTNLPWLRFDWTLTQHTTTVPAPVQLWCF